MFHENQSFCLIQNCVLGKATVSLNLAQRGSIFSNFIDRCLKY
jgi:hypothetical protein